MQASLEVAVGAVVEALRARQDELVEAMFKRIRSEAPEALEGNDPASVEEKLGCYIGDRRDELAIALRLAKVLSGWTTARTDAGGHESARATAGLSETR